MSEFIDTNRLRRVLERTAGAGSGEVKLPSTRAPDLTGLHVKVPAPQLTEQLLLERYHALLREHALMRDRAEDEEVQWGDEIRVDVFGVCDGKLLPFSTQLDTWLMVDEDAAFPGFFDALVGVQVGTAVEVPLILPDDHPLEQFRGRPALFMVEVYGAREILLPDDEDPEFLASLGRGATAEEVMNSVAEELEEELGEEMFENGQQLALDAVAAAAQVEVPDALVDEEIRRRWHDGEREVLLQKELSAEDLDESLQGWLSHPHMRAEARRSLRVALAVRAVADRDHVMVDRSYLEGFLSELAEITSTPVEELKQAFKEDPKLAAKLAQVAQHTRAVEHAVAQVQVEYLEA